MNDMSEKSGGHEPNSPEFSIPSWDAALAPDPEGYGYERFQAAFEGLLRPTTAVAEHLLEAIGDHTTVQDIFEEWLSGVVERIFSDRLAPIFPPPSPPSEDQVKRNIRDELIKVLPTAQALFAAHVQRQVMERVAEHIQETLVDDAAAGQALAEFVWKRRERFTNLLTGEPNPKSSGKTDITAAHSKLKEALAPHPDVPSLLRDALPQRFDHGGLIAAAIAADPQLAAQHPIAALTAAAYLRYRGQASQDNPAFQLGPGQPYTVGTFRHERTIAGNQPGPTYWPFEAALYAAIAHRAAQNIRGLVDGVQGPGWDARGWPEKADTVLSQVPPAFQAELRLPSAAIIVAGTGIPTPADIALAEKYAEANPPEVAPETCTTSQLLRLFLYGPELQRLATTLAERPAHIIAVAKALGRKIAGSHGQTPTSSTLPEVALTANKDPRTFKQTLELTTRLGPHTVTLRITPPRKQFDIDLADAIGVTLPGMGEPQPPEGSSIDLEATGFASYQALQEAIAELEGLELILNLPKEIIARLVQRVQTDSADICVQRWQGTEAQHPGILDMASLQALEQAGYHIYLLEEVLKLARIPDRPILDLVQRTTHHAIQQGRPTPEAVQRDIVLAIARHLVEAGHLEPRELTLLSMLAPNIAFDTPVPALSMLASAEAFRRADPATLAAQLSQTELIFTDLVVMDDRPGRNGYPYPDEATIDILRQSGLDAAISPDMAELYVRQQAGRLHREALELLGIKGTATAIMKLQKVLAEKAKESGLSLHPNATLNEDLLDYAGSVPLAWELFDKGILDQLGNRAPDIRLGDNNLTLEQYEITRLLLGHLHQLSVRANPAGKRPFIVGFAEGSGPYNKMSSNTIETLPVLSAQPDVGRPTVEFDPSSYLRGVVATAEAQAVLDNAAADYRSLLGAINAALAANLPERHNQLTSLSGLITPAAHDLALAASGNIPAKLSNLVTGQEAMRVPHAIMRLALVQGRLCWTVMAQPEVRK